jgi:hypothetical protein
MSRLPVAPADLENDCGRQRWRRHSSHSARASIQTPILSNGRNRSKCNPPQMSISSLGSGFLLISSGAFKWLDGRQPRSPNKICLHVSVGIGCEPVIHTDFESEFSIAHSPVPHATAKCESKDCEYCEEMLTGQSTVVKLFCTIEIPRLIVNEL